jgi:hypothetical protein
MQRDLWLYPGGALGRIVTDERCSGPLASSRHVRFGEMQRRRETAMYIGIGTIVLILAIVIVVMMARGRRV